MLNKRQKIIMQCCTYYKSYKKIIIFKKKLIYIKLKNKSQHLAHETTAHTRVFYFFNLVIRLNHFQKKMTCRLLGSKFGHQCVRKKQGFFVYPQNHSQLIFDPKHLGNTLRTLLNQSMASKNTKNRSKTQNQPKTQNSSQV